MNEKIKLSDKIAADIRQMILEDDLKPGDKLPNEIEMTEILNVSRSTLREAIKALVSVGVLEVRRGRGTFVTDTPGVSKDPLGISFIEEENLVNHFFEVRLMVEPNMAELAVLRGTEEELVNIKKAYKKVSEDIKAGIDHTESDIAFHNEIANSTNNSILQRIVPIINDGIKVGIDESKDNVESVDVVLKQHREIMEAIEAKDAKRAKKAMREHILYGLEQNRKNTK